MTQDHKKFEETIRQWASEVRAWTPEQFKACQYVLTLFDRVEKTDKDLSYANNTIEKLAKRVRELEKLVYQHEGGEDDGYGGKTNPITWKEAFEEDERYQTWAMKEMQKACDRIKAHPDWKYGENAYPSPYERAIVAGCGQAVEQLQKELADLKAENEKLKKDGFVIAYSVSYRGKDVETLLNSKLKLEAENEKLAIQRDAQQQAKFKLEAERDRLREALEKIAEYQMPRMQIKKVSLEEMTDLTHCIQDMAGLAKQALSGERK